MSKRILTLNNFNIGKYISFLKPCNQIGKFVPQWFSIGSAFAMVLYFTLYHFGSNHMSHIGNISAKTFGERCKPRDSSKKFEQGSNVCALEAIQRQKALQ